MRQLQPLSHNSIIQLGIRYESLLSMQYDPNLGETKCLHSRTGCLFGHGM